MRAGSDYAILEEITSTLLDPASDHGVLRDACVRMHELLTGICGLDDRPEGSIDTNETILPFGKAISPVDAGRCVLDLMRTTSFKTVAAWVEPYRDELVGVVVKSTYN